MANFQVGVDILGVVLDAVIQEQLRQLYHRPAGDSLHFGMEWLTIETFPALSLHKPPCGRHLESPCAPPVPMSGDKGVLVNRAVHNSLAFW